MTDAQRKRLQSAADLVSSKLREGATAAEIIAQVVELGGSYSPRWDTNRLSFAGVTATCTWSADTGLLDNWRRTATTRLMASA